MNIDSTQMKCRWKACNANFQKDINFVAFHFIFGKYKNKNVTPSFGSKLHLGQKITSFTLRLERGEVEGKQGKGRDFLYLDYREEKKRI